MILRSMFITIIFFLGGCNSTPSSDGAQAKTMAEKTLVSVVDTANWRGTYSGTVPVKGSVGMQMELNLNPSNTYSLMITYLQKNPKENQSVKFSGDIHWADDSTTIELKELDTISNKFRVKNGVVEYLNPDATPNTGKLADFYILKKKG